ncbi:hypothetical protein DPMN_179326 [Dreissena polymorpha]|uniref:Target of rapamycin complex 2 subunit MAPKAP1 n=1 Tax=Dreissena polymorpha TaxID=45954 RepID=A0A9D4EDT0_DREPO|nr:hypothetical protein DPMN_179326 [Dreissena polymorpha]
MDTLEFVLVRENSSRGDATEIDNGRSLEMAKSLTSHHYKSYLVSMVHKLRTNTEVQLGEATEIDNGRSLVMAKSLTSHHYKSYLVSMVHKLRTNTEVPLGISGEKVNIDPVVSKSSAQIFRQKAVTYDADNIASCDIFEEKDGGKSVFRLAYFNGHEFKHRDFEADTAVCYEIVQKFNNILELRLSPVGKEYVANRDKKLMKKQDSLLM